MIPEDMKMIGELYFTEQMYIESMSVQERRVLNIVHATTVVCVKRIHYCCLIEWAWGAFMKLPD